MLQRGSLIVAVMFWLLLSYSDLTLAKKNQEPLPEEFYNPLEIKEPDPLLPKRSLEQQPLTALERLKLTAALDELNRQAAAQFATGNKLKAFEIWNRELRVRRSLGALIEIQALRRVGAIAWNENERPQVQVITRRLQAIQQEALSKSAVNLQLLQSLGDAYQEVRELKSAIEVYQQILALARQQKNSVLEIQSLQTIGQLYLNWFNYQQAAAIYEELLSSARAKRDRVSEITYLQQLAYIYDQAKQYQQAIVRKQELSELYLNEEQFTQIPILQLAIASDYQALGDLEAAFRNYQEAYASAWSLQQYYRAADALQQLINLYRSQGQINEALETSTILLQAYERAANTFGLMNTYDQIGRIYLERKNFTEALNAFQKGLELAQQLKYQESYFAQQIDQVNQQIAQ